MPLERTLAIIKPDAIEARCAGEVLSMIEAAGFRLLGLRMVRLSRGDAEAFYAVHSQRPFFAALTEFMSSGPAIVLALEAEDAVAKWRGLMGPTDSTKAPPDTVRGRFGTDIQHNAVHGSDAPATAAAELAFFFDAGELA